MNSYQQAMCVLTMIYIISIRRIIIFCLIQKYKYIITYCLVIDPERHPRDNDYHKTWNVNCHDEKGELPCKCILNT